MTVQLIWFVMMAGSVLCAAATGRMEQIFPAMLEGCENAIALTLRLGAGYLLFCGLLEIARASGICKGTLSCLTTVLLTVMDVTQSGIICAKGLDLLRRNRGIL